jgi:flagellar hook-associated protein 1 FlgK
MSDLFAALNSASGALRAIQTALDVTQNNVSNSQTPGYAKQVPSFDAVSFQPEHGLAGGVVAGPTQDTRSQFAEIAVRQQVSLLGASSQLATSLDPIEQVLSVSDKNSISSALDALFQSFSAWSSNPNDVNARSSVLNAAAGVATAFRQSTTRLDRIRSSVDSDLRTTVASINRIAADIQKYNAARNSSTPDAGLDAQKNAALEQLSQLGDVQALTAADGTITVLLGGQVPLVTGDQLHKIGLSSTSSGLPTIVDENGGDVTQKISDGQLGALLSVRNQILPRLIGGPSDAGELNALASQVADAVNDVFTAAGGQKLFTYDSSSPKVAASTFSVAAGLQPTDLVAAEAGPPPVSNGVPLKLGELATSALTGLSGMTFSQFYASSASWIGSQLSQAQAASQAQTQTTAQARALRQQLSGVSLDEEATRLMELQRSYQAASRMVTVLDGLTQNIIDMIH